MKKNHCRFSKHDIFNEDHVSGQYTVYNDLAASLVCILLTRNHPSKSFFDLNFFSFQPKFCEDHKALVYITLHIALPPARATLRCPGLVRIVS